MPAKESGKTSSRLLQIASAIVVIWALRYAKEVLVPIALAVLFAFLLAPLVHQLERRKLPRVVAVLAVVLLSFGVLAGIGMIVASQVENFTQKLPEYTKKVSGAIDHFRGKPGIISKITQAGQQVAKDMSASKPATTQAATPSDGGTLAATGVLGNDAAATAGGDDRVQKVQIVSSTPPAIEAIVQTLGPLLSVLATSFIVIVLCIFMLMAREDLRDRVIRLVSNGHLNVTTQAMDDAAKRVSRYLLMQALTNGAYGLLVAAGLGAIHVPNALLWGLMATLLRFIPYVGPWLAAAGPVLVSFVTLGSHRGFATIGLYVTLEIIVSSFVEPWLYGSNTGVSSIAILIAAVFWAWLWGGVGLLLATPLTVLLVVIGKYVPQLEFLSVLLGDDPVFDPPTRYYQRLLAADQEEATELVEQYLKQMPLEQLYEVVMIPALGLAHRDRFRGRLDGERAEFIRTAMREEIRELGERPPPPEPIVPSAGVAGARVAPTANSESTAQNAGRKADDVSAAAAQRAATQRTRIIGAESVHVLCLPARDEADELAGVMFAQLLEQNGLKAEAVSTAALASEMVELVGKMKADIVVLSALPPSAITHARYLCKRIHQAFPEVVIVIGLWTQKVDVKETRERISCTGRDVVTVNFSDGLTQVEQLVHPLLLQKGSVATSVVPAGSVAEEKAVAEREKKIDDINRELTPSKIGAAAEKRDRESTKDQKPPSDAGDASNSAADERG